VRAHRARIDRGSARDHEPIALPGPVRTDPAEVVGPVDVAFVAVKDTQNEQAGAWLARLCDERTVVCALQNGVEQVERVGRFCPSSTVVPTAVWLSAEIQPEGWVRARTEPRLVLPDSEAAGTLAELLRPAGVRVCWLSCRQATFVARLRVSIASC
jgi:2-dehydropantoate 2-reductase